MCGVVAVLPLQTATPALAERCRRGVMALRHRGPDGQAVYATPQVALGHARLALLDRRGGAQPLHSEDGQVSLVQNGEIYDHAATRDDLRAAGHVFSSASDSEVTLHLYEERGLAFVRALQGEFALVLWDARRRRLVAARDRFGVKPLCYAITGGAGAKTLLLASEVKALLAMGLPAAWDSQALHQALSLQYLLPQQTLFRGAQQLPPGHLLVVEDGQVTLQRYWDLDYPRQRTTSAEQGDDSAGDVGAHDQAHGQALVAALTRAVQRRCQADPDVRVAALLSGGLDSSVVAGLLARQSAALTCFCVSFPGGGAYDELAVAQRSAAALGAELQVIAAPPQALWAALPQAVAAGEGLAINLHLAAKHLLCAAVRDAGFRVLLTGEGADELLGGYAHLRRDYLLAGGAVDPALLADRAGTLVTTGVHLPEGASLPLTALAQHLGVVPSFLQAKGTLGQRLRGLLAEDFAAQHAARDPAAALLGAVDLSQLEGRHPVDQAAYLWTKLALCGYILRTLGDGMEMAHSVEGRLPFLDDEVFQVARAAGVAARLRGGIEKQLLRTAARRAGLVTEEVAQRPKHPFMAPPLGGTSGDGSPEQRAAGEELLHDTLRGDALLRVPCFSAPRVRALLDRLPALSPRERVATDPALMLVLTATLLQRSYGLSA